MPYPSTQEKRERKEECAPILFIFILSLSLFFWPLKSPHPTPPLLSQSSWHQGFLKCLLGWIVFESRSISLQLFASLGGVGVGVGLSEEEESLIPSIKPQRKLCNKGYLEYLWVVVWGRWLYLVHILQVQSHTIVREDGLEKKLRYLMTLGGLIKIIFDPCFWHLKLNYTIWM